MHHVTSRILYGSSRNGVVRSGDPIAAAIGLLRPDIAVDASLRAAGEWAVRFEPFPHVKVGGVMRGECLLIVEGHEPVQMGQGDVFLLCNPPPHVLASTPTAVPRAAKPLWDGATNGVVRIGPESEEDTVLCTGYFAFDTESQNLIDVLPPLVHVSATDPRGRLLTHVTELLADEVGNGAVGSAMVQDHLVQILFVHMLRAHAEQVGRPTGWLGALGDDGIGRALRAMHADVARRWTLDELAAISLMSRSAFAAAFKRQVGTAPLEYLIEWRMSLARDALRRGTASISEITSAIGYRSESAFSTAFRRVVGSSPKQFRDAARR
jgi:AraC-like DNA-binding protein